MTELMGVIAAVQAAGPIGWVLGAGWVVSEVIGAWKGTDAGGVAGFIGRVVTPGKKVRK